MSHIMFDLETLGTGSDTMILTVAAVRFEPETGQCFEKFYEKIDIDSYKTYSGRFSFDGSTLTWWMLNVTEEARVEAFGNGKRDDLRIVMEKLQNWLKRFGERFKVWSHGSVFDIPILTHTFKVLNLEIPWKFWDIRDTRTLYELGDINFKNIPSVSSYPEHHALGDCLKQIEGVKLALIGIKQNERPIKRRK